MTRDEAEIGAIVEAMYAMISGPKGPRDWSRQRDIFHPDARQMRTGVDGGGRSWIKIMNLAEYAADTTSFFGQNDFFEVETARHIQVFGNMAHVWSHYEARRAPADTTPERRGINSIQFYRDDGGRWQITSMIWDNERPALLRTPDVA